MSPSRWGVLVHVAFAAQVKLAGLPGIAADDVETTFSLIPGARYGYRLGLPDPGGEVAAGETWIEVPARAEFALAGARPNPAVGRVTVSFSLPDDSPAVLEVMDPAGRRVLRREVGEMGAGFHVLPVGDGSTPGNGVYLVRLSRQGRVLTTKLVLLR